MLLYVYMFCLMEQPQLCSITAFMAKGSLHSFLRSSEGQLVWPAHARLALGGARGMEFLHSAKVSWRDCA